MPPGTLRCTIKGYREKERCAAVIIVAIVSIRQRSSPGECRSNIYSMQQQGVPVITHTHTHVAMLHTHTKDSCNRISSYRGKNCVSGNNGQIKLFLYLRNRKRSGRGGGWRCKSHCRMWMHTKFHVFIVCTKPIRIGGVCASWCALKRQAGRMDGPTMSTQHTATQIKSKRLLSIHVYCVFVFRWMLFECKHFI